MGGSLKCQNDDKNICVIRGPVPLYCGNAELDVDFNARRGATKIVGKMNVLSGLPEGVSGGELPEITATIIPENGLDFTFKSCEIKFDKTKCASCTVCDNKRDFKFNCSNINVNPTAGGIPVEGPALTECEGFGFLGDI